MKTIVLCRALLKSGAILVVCVPNDVLAWTSKIKTIGKRLGLRPFQKFSSKIGLPRAFGSREIHLSHFTATTLRRGLEQAGLAVVYESLDPYYSASGISLVLHSAYYAFHRCLFALSHVNRYNAIWMMARNSSS